MLQYFCLILCLGVSKKIGKFCCKSIDVTSPEWGGGTFLENKQKSIINKENIFENNNTY